MFFTADDKKLERQSADRCRGQGAGRYHLGPMISDRRRIFQFPELPGRPPTHYFDDGNDQPPRHQVVCPARFEPHPGLVSEQFRGRQPGRHQNPLFRHPAQKTCSGPGAHRGSMAMAASRFRLTPRLQRPMPGGCWLNPMAGIYGGGPYPRRRRVSVRPWHGRGRPQETKRPAMPMNDFPRRLAADLVKRGAGRRPNSWASWAAPMGGLLVSTVDGGSGQKLFLAGRGLARLPLGRQ